MLITRWDKPGLTHRVDNQRLKPPSVMENVRLSKAGSLEHFLGMLNSPRRIGPRPTTGGLFVAFLFQFFVYMIAKFILILENKLKLAVL